MRKHLQLCAAATLLFGCIAAQDARYDLGLRVRAFERTFEPVCADVAVRARVCPTLELAVQSFFGIRLDEVARNMDEARRLVATGEPAEPATRWADSLSLRLSSRCLAQGTAELPFELRAAYDADVELPPAARVGLRLVDAAGSELQPLVRLTIESLPMRGALPLTVDTPGDHRLLVEIEVGDAVLSRHEQLLSLAPDLDRRLEALAATAKASPTDTLTATARGLTRTLQALARGGTRETDVPAVRHLGEVEAITNGDSPFAIDRPGDFRIWLQTTEGTVATRVMVPPKPCAERIPLVIAMHGAGGSENMFFDGYGAGKVVALCRTRGWLLVAPRSGFGGTSLDAIIDALAGLYPVDRDRVHAIGHSMGAAQLMSFASRHPESLRAIALLGGGGSARPSAGLAQLPIFLAPGEKDFALANARRLRDALNDAGVERLDYREYEAAEHLGVVQIALDDVFRFFDGLATGK